MAKTKKSLAKSTLSFILTVGAILGFRWALFEPFVIPSGSMIPSLLINDHIVVNKAAFGIRIPFTKNWLTSPSLPSRGDIVVFRSLQDDGFLMIKRVIGLPGDIVSFDDSGHVFINGKGVDRRVLVHGETEDGFYPVTQADLGKSLDSVRFFEESLPSHKYRTLFERTSYRWADEGREVPKDHIFVMGDNRDNSKDSRYWGALPVNHLLGKAMFVWLSCEKTIPNISFLCDPLTVRWKRFFHNLN